jgi:hypothetical protein
MSKKLFRAVVIKGTYIGHEGLATPMNLFGNVMIYFDEEELPYRVCLNFEDIKYLDD